MDTLKPLAAFVRVFERGNYTAAEDFRITPAMAGVHVRAPEQRRPCGCSLSTLGEPI
ncbi:hypothetical protein [Dyella telluris]|uniref:Uncharacterized protein n=1 Tax=Dyella telluris TaxID=2763498 RepID=A0A7G8Q5T0_9GAMM|nr:hypothetical protein [Dyella telluris]QNK02138.1 hypothetical protein H8F01_02940 [Dyella telluris]